MVEMGIRPSDLLGYLDEYTAFCFDEACAYIIQQLRDGKKPIFNYNSQDGKVTYSKPSDLYNKYKN